MDIMVHKQRDIRLVVILSLLQTYPLRVSEQWLYIRYQRGVPWGLEDKALLVVLGIPLKIYPIKENECTMHCFAKDMCHCAIFVRGLFTMIFGIINGRICSYF